MEKGSSYSRRSSALLLLMSLVGVVIGLEAATQPPSPAVSEPQILNLDISLKDLTSPR